MKVDGIRKLCDLFGCSHEAIRAWQAEGLPVIERGGAGRPSIFDSAAVHEWLVERAVRKAVNETPRDRLDRARAESVEFDLRVKRSQYIPVDVIEPKWTAACVAAREMLLHSRRELARRLVTVTGGAPAMEKVIAETHERFLRTLSEWSEDDTEDGAK